MSSERQQDLQRFNEETDNKDRQFVTALARGLEILRCFRAGEALLGNQEIAKRTGLPKPTISRLTYTLTQLGYLKYVEKYSKYALGNGVLALGYSFLSNMGIREIARPFMQELADFSQTAVAIGARDRLSMVYLENVRSKATLTLRLDIGSRVSLGTSSMGRAFLAALPEHERSYLMEHLQKREENNWLKVKDGIEKAIEQYESQGFCVSLGDWEREVHAISVPYIPHDGSDILVFNCGGPAFLMKPEVIHQEIAPRMLEMVNKIAAMRR